MSRFAYVIVMGIVYITLAHVAAKFIGGEPHEFLLLLTLMVALGARAPSDD